MCNLYSITNNQAAIRALFRKVNRYVGNLAPMTGVFPTTRPGDPQQSLTHSSPLRVDIACAGTCCWAVAAVSAARMTLVESD